MIIIVSSEIKLESSHPAVLRRHVVPQVVLGEVHSESLVCSPSLLIFVSVSVALLVKMIVLSGLIINQLNIASANISKRNCKNYINFWWPHHGCDYVCGGGHESEYGHGRPGGCGRLHVGCCGCKIFHKIFLLACPLLPLPVVVRVFVLMFLFMRMIMSLFGEVTELSDPTRGEKRSDVIVW